MYVLPLTTKLNTLFMESILLQVKSRTESEQEEKRKAEDVMAAAAVDIDSNNHHHHEIASSSSSSPPPSSTHSHSPLLFVWRTLFEDMFLQCVLTDNLDRMTQVVYVHHKN